MIIGMFSLIFISTLIFFGFLEYGHYPSLSRE